MNDIIFLTVQLAIAIAAFAAGKYIFPKVPKTVTDKLNMLSQWAAQFVVWAKEFMKKQSGEEKMQAVVEKLKEIADEAGLDVTEDQLKAIAQSAYNAMKAGEAAAEYELQPAQVLGAIAAPATPTVVINTGTTAVATNTVPDEALKRNPDGTVNVYDEDGNKTGTITAEEAARAEAGVTNIEIE